MRAETLRRAQPIARVLGCEPRSPSHPSPLLHTPADHTCPTTCTAHARVSRFDRLYRRDLGCSSPLQLSYKLGVMGLFSKVKTPQRFGSCCEDLSAAMTQPEQSMFRVEDSGVFYVSVGFVSTPQGPAWFDQAVLFCPFCGTQLQTRDEIAARGNDA
jgi:hypothetical protein